MKGQLGNQNWFKYHYHCRLYSDHKKGMLLLKNLKIEYSKQIDNSVFWLEKVEKKLVVGNQNWFKYNYHCRLYPNHKKGMLFLKNLKNLKYNWINNSVFDWTKF